MNDDTTKGVLSYLSKKNTAKWKVANAMDKINRFVQSDWFIVFDALLILIGWIADVWAIMLCVIIVLNVLPLFFFKGTKHLLAILMMFMQIIRTNRHSLESFLWLVALVPVLLLGLIVNLARFKPNFKSLRPRKIRGFHLSLLLLMIPFAFGGAGSQTEKPMAIFVAFALILLVGVGYTFFYVTNVDSKDKKGLMDYVVKVLAMMGLVATIECLIVLGSIEGSIIEVVIYATKTRCLDVGWAGPNNVGIALAMTIPATLYLCIKKNYATPLLVLLSVVELALVMMTGSRGSILCAGATLLPATLYVMVKTKNKLLFGGSVSLAVVAVALVLIQNGELLQTFLARFISSGLDSNGRVDWLFVEAIDAFKQNPMFGEGWDYRLGGLTSDSYSPYWYHSTAMQILANMGVCGVIFFLPFYFFRYTAFLRQLKTSSAACALLCSTLIFEVYGMMDTLYFGPTFFIVMVIMTLVVEINLPERMSKMERYSLTLDEFDYKK